MAKKMKTRLDELFEADVDYSVPIDTFSDKARILFNKEAKSAGVKTRVYANEYGDGAARLYLDIGNDSLSAFAGMLSVFAYNVELLATANKKLAGLNLPVTSVTFHGDEIDINF